MLNPDFRDILSAFIDGNAEFLVVGAYSVAVHGVPRATGDLDLWIRPTPANAGQVWNALERFGAALDGIVEADLTVADTVVQLGVTPRRIDLLTSIDGVDFEEAWAARITVEVDGMRLPVLAREHLIRNKRATGRPQDIADADRLEAQASRGGLGRNR